MKKLTAAQTKSITNAKDQVKAAANVMIETPLELIKCILLKHETAVIGVMKELHEEKMRLQQQRDELVAALKTIKKTVCGERIPNWESDWNTTHTRGIIADVCDIAIAKVKP